MHRWTIILAAATAAALLAGCAGPPAEESTHTREPGDVGPISSDIECAPASDASGAGEERVAGDPIGDVATREGGPATGDGNNQVPPACEDPVTAPGSTPQG